MSTTVATSLDDAFFGRAPATSPTPASVESTARYQEAALEVRAPSNLTRLPSEDLETSTRRPSPTEPSKPTPARLPKVSVLVPTYNYGRYLPETIESVLAQDFQDFELIIVDDCSRDNSAAVIKHYAGLDDRIRYKVNPKNLGMVANWNYCLSLARGEYIKFLFGDDTLADRQALKKMVAMLDENPSAVLAVSARNILDEHSRITEIMDHLGENGRQAGRDIIVRCLETNANLVGEPSVVMMRKRDAARGFNPNYRQLTDLEMWFHLLEKGDAIYTSEPLCSFRKHALQQTEVNKIQQIGEKEQVILLTEFFTRPWVKTGKRRKLMFTQIYWLRKQSKRGSGSPEMEKLLLGTLGVRWYAWYYTLHKLCRPFQNLRRFYLKHILGHSVK
jgi:glycosyltransferase involved in cell wall biosynthesis